MFDNACRSLRGIVRVTLALALLYFAADSLSASAQTPAENPGTSRKAPRTRKTPRKPVNPPQEDGNPIQGEVQSPQPEPEAPPADPNQPDEVVIPPEVQKQIDDMIQNQPAAQPEVVPPPGQKTAEQRAEERRQRLRNMSQANPPGGRPNIPQPGMPQIDPGAEGAGRKIEIPAGDRATPPEQRKYSFSIKDGGYDVLIEGIARETGLGVVGEAPPDGKVTFITDEELSFDELLSRVRMLLFRYKPLDPYWLLRRPTHLEVIRVNDYPRVIPPDKVFRTVDLFRAANLPPDELVIVLFTPTTGSLADLEQVRQFMPDYMRVTPLEDQNTVAIFALVSDVEKYLWWVDMIVGRKADPRKLEIIEVKFITPTEAFDKLQLLMQLAPGQAPRVVSRPGRPGEVNPLAGISAPDVSIVPEDAQGVLIVRAMQDKIDEIKLLLPFVDVNTAGSNYLPVVIPVKHASPEALVTTVQQILGASADSGATPGMPQNAAPKRPRRARPGVVDATATAVSAADVTLIPHPVSSAIIAIGPDDVVARVRELVNLFDVAGVVGPLRIQLQFTDAETAVAAITQLLTGGPSVAQPPGSNIRSGPSGSQVIADPSGTAIWFTGSQKDEELVRSLLKDIDVAQEPVTLHIVKLINVKPTFVAGILAQFDAGGPASAAAPGATTAPRRRGRAPSPAAPQPAGTPANVAAKFNPDDEKGFLYIHCTEAEWTAYKDIIRQLEDAVIGTELAVIAVQHISPEEALAKVSVIMPDAGNIRWETTDGGLVVANASELQLRTIRSILAEFDTPQNIEERTFEIVHADPAEVKAAIEALIGDTTAGQPAVRRARPARPDQPTPMPVPSSGGATAAPLTIVQVDNRLIVKASPVVMTQVADYIKQFDVKADGRLIKVYQDFAPGADIESIANTLAQVLGGTPRASSPRAPRAGQAVQTVAEPLGPQFIPQSASNKLLVIADKALYPEIEELLAMLRHETPIDPQVVEFVPVRYADPAVVVESIDPLLAMMVRNLIRTGDVLEITDDIAAVPSTPGRTRLQVPGARAQDQKPYHLSADSRNKRVVIAATQKIVDEAKDLIARFDQEPKVADVVFEFLTVQFGDPAELVDQIEPLLNIKAQQMVNEAEIVDQPDMPQTAPIKGGPRIAASRSENKRFHIAPDARNRRIVIAAPQPVVEEARMLVGKFDQPGVSDSVEVAFVRVEHADPFDLVELIDPLLSIKVKELERGGELIEDLETAAPATNPAQQRLRNLTNQKTARRYHLEPDSRNKQIVIAAPQSVIDEATKLIVAFDKPPLTREQDFVTVALHNAKPEDMVRAIKEVMGAPARTSVTRTTKRGEQSPPAAPALDVTFSAAFSIVAAPGGGAVVLQGPTNEVAQAKQWVEHLDRMAVSDRQIKVYQIEFANTETLVDLIMNVVDTAAAEAPQGRRAQIPKLKGDEEEDDWDEPFKTTVTKNGKDIYVKADLIDDTIIVAGTAGKIAEVDALIAQFDTSVEAERTRSAPVPKRMFELKFAEAFDAEDALEAVLEAIWNPSDTLPKVTTGPFGLGETLVVSFPDESRFPEIEEIIRKYVDKPDEEKQRKRTVVITTPSGLSPEEFIRFIELNNSGLTVEAVDVTPKTDRDFGLEQVKAPRRNGGTHPCVLPLSLRDAGHLLGGMAVMQTPPEDEPEVEESGDESADDESVDEQMEPEPDPDEVAPPIPPPANIDRVIRDRAQEAIQSPDEKPTKDSDDEEKRPKSYRGEPLRVEYNNLTGEVTIVGPSGVLEDLPDWLEDIEDMVKDAPKLPDIRIYRVRYIDVHTAQSILQELFNATRQQLQLHQQQALQQQRLAQQAARNAARQQQPDQKGDQPGQQPGRQQQPQQPIQAVPEIPQESVRIFANPRDRTLILRADTNQYPAIEELLATIDQPKPFDSHHLVIPLKKLNATDVEALLKDWLGLEETPDRTSRSRGRAAGQQPGAIQIDSGTGPQLPQTITEPIKSGTALLGVDPEDIKLSSNAENNTLLVMAPRAALDYIENLVNELESNEIAEREWRSYYLQYADPEEVREYLATRFPSKRETTTRSRGGAQADTSAPVGSALNTATFVAYPRLRMISVQATDEQLTQIDEIIQNLDVEDASSNFKTVNLQHANARVVADTLDAMFGQGTRATRSTSGGRDGAAPASPTATARFLGDEGGRIVFYSAPERLHARILEVIQELEDQSQSAAATRVVPLRHAQAEDVADSLNRIYEDRKKAGGPSSGGRGTPTATPYDNVVITPDANTNEVIVQAGESEMEFILQRIAELDRPEVAGTAAMSTRIYPLKTADPNSVVNMIKEWTKTQQQGAGGTQRRVSQKDQILAVADPGTQTVVVTASEANHERIREVVDGLDTEGSGNRPQVKSIVMKKADPYVVQEAISQLFKADGKNPRDQVTAVAESSTNSVVVSASPENLQRVEELIAALDTDNGPTGDGFRIVQIAPGVNVTDLAEKVEASINEAAAQRLPPGSTRQAPQITVTADTRTGTLIIAGAPSLFDGAEKIATTIMGSGPQGKPSTVVLSTTNITPEDIEALIRQLTTPPGDAETGGAARRGGAGGNTSGGARRTSPPRSRPAPRR